MILITYKHNQFLLFCVGTQVTVNAVHPGIVKTDLGRHMGVAKNFISSALFAPFTWLFMKTAEEGMQTILYCALEPSLEGKSGGYYRFDICIYQYKKIVKCRLWN